MAICKFCGVPFSWGKTEEGRFVPLVPVGEDSGLDRAFQDENGALRAEHRIVCILLGGPTVRVSRLARPIPGGEVIGGGWTEPDPEGEVRPVAATLAGAAP